MDEDTRRNTLFIGVIVLLGLCVLVGATMGGYIDWGKEVEAMRTARPPAENPDLLWESAQEFYADADRDPKMKALAEGTARRILIVDPKYLRARKMLAALHLKDKEWQDAEVQCRTVLTADPKDVTARLGLGAALRGQNKNKEAVEAYRAVWNDGTAGVLQKDEASRNLQALDPAFKPDPMLLTPELAMPSPSASPSAPAVVR